MWCVIGIWKTPLRKKGVIPNYGRPPVDFIYGRQGQWPD